MLKKMEVPLFYPKQYTQKYSNLKTMSLNTSSGKKTDNNMSKSADQYLEEADKPSNVSLPHLKQEPVLPNLDPNTLVYDMENTNLEGNDVLLPHLSKNLTLCDQGKSSSVAFRNEKVLCKFFVKNKCTKGENCHFSHTISNFSDTEILKCLSESVDATSLTQ